MTMKRLIPFFLALLVAGWGTASAQISGSLSVCVGSTTVLTAVPAGGTWSSTVPGNGTVGAVTGIVGGVAAGTTVISYVQGVTTLTATVTVNTLPSLITGLNPTCNGTNGTLTSSPSGGTWVSQSVGVATINPTTGDYTTVAAGNSVISYTLPTGCRRTTTLSVNNIPATISGVNPICIGSSATFSSTTVSQTWSSSNSAVATVATLTTTTAVVTAVSTGTVDISYTNAAGCSRVFTVNITPALDPITGGNLICGPTGSTLALSHVTGGGTWTSSGGAATVNTSTGLVTSTAATGTTTVTYSTSTACRVFNVVTVEAALPSITNPGAFCVGNNATFSIASTGGTWVSGNTGLATIVPATGVATGVASGNPTISYTKGPGCTRTTLATVNPLPAAITGTTTVCAGSTTTLSSATGGGTWISGNAAIATVGSSTGVVTGVASGVVAITYQLSSTSCNVIQNVTVNAQPNVITGTLTACEGTTTTLSSTTPGGNWSSSNTSIATVNSSGVVSALLAGTTTISYVIPGTGCFRTAVVTVNANPAVIGGAPFTVCDGSTITLTNATASGTWSSSNTAVGTINSSTGVFQGLTSGNSTVSYTITATGCFATQVVTVNARPAVITGTLSVCEGLTTTLASATSGGAWTSSATGTATVGASTGVVTGVAAGNATISYTMPNTCFRTAAVTVNITPAAIGGSTTLCDGSTTTLTNATVGGTWVSSNTVVATVGSLTGLVTGLSSGVTTISYVMPSTGCMATQVVTVNARPAVITGASFVCEGSTITLSSATSGGVWTSSATGTATVGASTGVVSGVAAGNAIITYTGANSCFRTATVSVGVTPAAITGDFTICFGATNTLSSSPVGQVWSSSNTTVASVNASTGAVTGNTVGTARITYTHASTCFATTVVTVSTGPNTGDSIVCEGSTVQLSNSTTGGVWTSSSPANATVNASTGLVSGIAVGNAQITYTVAADGCSAITNVTVNPALAAITGVNYVCLGYTTTLSHPLAGGTWSSSNTSIATVGLNTGVVTGVSNGVATITYTYTSGCQQTIQVTVNNILPGVTGPGNMCVGVGTYTYSHTIPGGTWSTSNSLVATAVSSTGVVTPLNNGIINIVYTLGAGCAAVRAVTVNQNPIPSVGSNVVCVGSTVGLTNYMGDGSWSSANPSIATIGTGSGVVTGVAPGTAVITYTMYTGCFTTRVQTVNVSPDPVVGLNSICSGNSTTYTCATTGGTWSTSNTAVATINSSTGEMTTIIGGVVNVSYTLPTGCSSHLVVTVGQTPAVVSGSSSMCNGSSQTLTSTPTGMTWSSDNSSIVSINSSTGLANAVGVGNTTISYTHTSGCTRTFNVTVNPAASTISGEQNTCIGQTTALTNASTGGIWTSSTSSVAIVGGTTGLVTGTGVGTANITYTLATGCYATVVVTVDATPATITGTRSLCIGSTTTLGHPVSGGTWTSSNTARATVDASGIVTGVASGTANITYALSAGCYQVAMVTVNVVPSSISGTALVCEGATTALSTTSGAGTWSSSNISNATVGSLTGIVSGISAGVADITFTSFTGCFSTRSITVNAAPAAITGTSSICIGQPSTLTSATSGGTWVSTNTSVATVGTGGVVTGLNPGTTTIRYTSAGCAATTIVTVNETPAPISGPSVFCVTGIATYVSDSPGHTWSVDNMAFAEISSMGELSSVTTIPSVVTISYTHIVTGCVRTKTVSLVALPTITGADNICIGSATTFTTGLTGGTWSVASSSVSIGSTSGVLTGISTGVAEITYTGASAGCMNVKSVTVDAAVSSITGVARTCVGGNTTLANAVTGGSWSSSNTAIATVSASTGEVTGIAAGTARITYATSAACFATVILTVNPALAALSGASTVCEGATASLSTTATGGTWSSSDTMVARVTPTSGVITGITAGVATISYAITSSCASIRQITVNASPAGITGVLSTCVGQSTTLANAVTGGSWSSSMTTRATVGASTGLVTGVSGGTVNITYALTSGCRAIAVVTVATAPSTVTGPNVVCVGSPITYTAAIGGGTWSSSDTAILNFASSTSGAITVASTGVAVITYTQGSGCTRTVAVTANPAVGAITGGTTVCLGQTLPLTSTTTGGTWASSLTSRASVGLTTGIVTGVNTGSVVITYRTGAGCYATNAMTVLSALPAIAGPSTVCVGQTSTQTNTVSGGSWSSSNTARATVDGTTGVVTGVSTGSVNITYTISTGCFKVRTLTVGTVLPITGTASVCEGSTTVLSYSGSAGTWSVASTEIISVPTTTGIVAGLSAGSSLVSFTLANGCVATREVTVNARPAAITGSLTLCVSNPSTLSSATADGVWTSASTSVATINSSTGVVTPNTSGNSVISYTLSNGCRRTAVVTVVASPSIPTFISTVCVGNMVTVNATPTGGSWSTSNYNVYMEGSTLTGVTEGTSTITYTNPSTACYRTATVTVAPALAAIVGEINIAIGDTTRLTHTTSGGTWSSDASTVATVNTTGLVRGVSSGYAVITYRTSPGCATTHGISVLGSFDTRPGKGSISTTENAVVGVYPNPTSGQMTITTTVAGTVVIYAMDGKVVREVSVDATSTSIDFPMDAANGMYVVRFVDINGNVTNTNIMLRK